MKNRKHTTKKLSVILGLLITTSLIPLNAVAFEAIANYVGKFSQDNPGEDRCCTGCDDLNHADNIADGFLDGLNDIGGYSDRVTHSNKTVDAKDLCDEDVVSWGRDHLDSSGSDWADTVLLVTHGYCINGDSGDGCSNSSNNYSAFIMGENQNTCEPRTNDVGGSDLSHFYFGDGDGDEENKAFIVFSCQSAQYSVWDDGGYRDLDGSKFRIYNAFHGNTWSSTGSSIHNRMERYVEDAENNEIGEAWLDRFYNRPIGSNNDRCPISIVYGSSSNNRENFYEYGGFRDWNSTGTNSGTTYFYMSPCNPSGGPTL